LAFDAYSETKSGNGASQESKIDWDAMNKYVVETANLQQRETLVGYIAGIVDLGTQALADAEAVFAGSPEEEAEIIAEKPNTYFKDGSDPVSKKPVRLKCWPQDPAQCVTLAIDFPDIMLDKGQFFGEEDAEPKPLRLWLGGQFYLKDVGMVVGRPIPLKFGNIAPKGSKAVWSFKPNHTLYKMAVGAKLVEAGKPFMPKDIDSLIGVALQFEAQVFFKENKGKQYYTEYVAYKTGLGRGQVAPTPVTPAFMIQMNKPNVKEAVAELRSHVINTVKRASNYPGSVLEKELNELRPPKQDDVPQEQEEAPKSEPKKAAAPVKKVAAPAQNADFDDSDIPFANPYRGRICLAV